MKSQLKGISDQEFEHLVDKGFDDPLQPPRKRGRQPTAIPDTLAKELELDGAAPGLSKSAARFNGAMRRILGTKHPTSEKSIEFLKQFDAGMKKACRARGIELRDETVVGHVHSATQWLSG